jgi:hypothetical protein
MPLRHETTQDEFQEMAARLAEEKEVTRMAEETMGTEAAAQEQEAFPPGEAAQAALGGPVPEPPAEAAAEGPKDDANHRRSQGVKRYWEKRKALAADHDFTPVTEYLAKHREELQAEFDRKVEEARREFEERVAGFRKELMSFDAAVLILEGD